MAKFIRYTLAAICLATSVGCLALWGWTATHKSMRLAAIYPSDSRTVNYFVNDGDVSVGLGHPLTPRQTARGPQFVAVTMSELDIKGLHSWRLEDGLFGHGNRAIFSPLWYPALIFALAGVAALRFRRQFSIRSALVAVTVVAALLGMAVAL